MSEGSVRCMRLSLGKGAESPQFIGPLLHFPVSKLIQEWSATNCSTKVAFPLCANVYSCVLEQCSCPLNSVRFDK